MQASKLFQIIRDTQITFIQGESVSSSAVARASPHEQGAGVSPRLRYDCIVDYSQVFLVSFIHTFYIPYPCMIFISNRLKYENIAPQKSFGINIYVTQYTVI